jgi:hypothetical protein
MPLEMPFFGPSFLTHSLFTLIASRFYFRIMSNLAPPPISDDLFDGVGLTPMIRIGTHNNGKPSFSFISIAIRQTTISLTFILFYFLFLY